MRGRAGKLVTFGVATLLLSASAMAQDVLAPSGTPAYIPAAGEPFASYLDKNRSNITSALRKTHYPGDTQLAFQHRNCNGQSTQYTLEDAVELRMPFELAGNCPGKGAGMGFPALTVPVFMAVSGDDATISAQAAAEFYCNKARVEGSRILVPVTRCGQRAAAHGMRWHGGDQHSAAR